VGLEVKITSFLTFHYGGEFQLQDPIVLSREWSKYPLRKTLFGPWKAASTFPTETFPAPAGNLTKFPNLFSSILSHYTDRDILSSVSVPIQLQSQNLMSTTINKQVNTDVQIIPNKISSSSV
jgi:hypothetical protein